MTITDDTGGQAPDDTLKEEDEPVEPAGATYEPCGHPLERGSCWFAQIAEPCGRECKWAIEQEPAGR